MKKLDQRLKADTSDRVLTRAVGILNIVFATLGLYVEWRTWMSASRVSNTVSAPFVVDVFYAMSMLNLIIMSGLAAAGFLLIFRGIGGVVLTLVVFGAEIAYAVALVVVPFQGYLGRSISAAAGIGSVAIMVQAIIGYPLVGIIALSLSLRRRSRAASIADLQV